MKIISDILLLNFSEATASYFDFRYYTFTVTSKALMNEDSGKLPYLSPNILLEGSLRNREQTYQNESGLLFDKHQMMNSKHTTI